MLIVQILWDYLVKRVYISQIERGKDTPAFETAERLAECLGYSLEVCLRPKKG
ncbi:helix-turn-helix transcriptional regulator [Candidatus Peregrinibacteria bacterium]|nr:helix-turn-helix transcriptional regulator [Candidatus Peregrinibacteria bacterium]